jgi:hypothetical protein
VPRWLFPHSLDDPAVYAAAQDHWLDLWRSITDRLDPARRWRTPWVDNPARDGNPIFTAVGESRGVRIVQEDPRDPDDIDLDWWIDVAGDPNLPHDAAELVIACCPSSENTPEVERLLREWLTTGRVNASTRADDGANGSLESAIPNGNPLDSTKSDLPSL